MRQERGLAKVVVGLFAVLLCVPSMGGASIAQAQPEEAQRPAQTPEESEAMARQRYEAGQVHAEAGRYQQAHDEFSAGYRLSRRPLFLYNMAEASYELGQHQLAEREYERYVRQDPDGATAPRARERLATLSALHDAGSDVVPPPEETARAASGIEPPVILAPSIDETTPGTAAQWYEDWLFWTIVASAAVVIGVGLAIGITLTNEGSQPECGMGCFRLDIGGST